MFEFPHEGGECVDGADTGLWEEVERTLGVIDGVWTPFCVVLCLV